MAELLADLEGCNARSVFLFLDRSYPGPLARKLLASGRHGNVVLVSGQLGSDVARGSAPSEFWARPQPAQCLLQDLGQVGRRGGDPEGEAPAGQAAPSPTGDARVTLQAQARLGAAPWACRGGHQPPACGGTAGASLGHRPQGVPPPLGLGTGETGVGGG